MAREAHRPEPSVPAAQPFAASEKTTVERSAAVPEAWATQVRPPSLVATIVPAKPTAHPRSASTNVAS